VTSTIFFHGGIFFQKFSRNFITYEMFSKFLTLIMYTFSTQLQLSNGKCMSIQQETRSCLSGFPLGCCDHNILFIIMITTMYFEIRPSTKLVYFPNSKLWIMLMEIKMFFHVGTKKICFICTHSQLCLVSIQMGGLSLFQAMILDLEMLTIAT
jgi:hypothetical protein